jgi:hypothetical protein
MIEDPWAVKKVVAVLEDKPFWETYIEPKTVGILGLRARKEDNQECVFSFTRSRFRLMGFVQTCVGFGRADDRAHHV